MAEAGPSGLGGGDKNLGVTLCVSGTKLRILDPEKGDYFAAHLHMTMTGAELAAVSHSLISCNKTDSAIRYP